MNTLSELLAQRDALDKQIAQLRDSERKGAIEKARELILAFGLTAADVYQRQARKGQAVAVKYRDPSTGATWTGRGRAPKWIEGKDRAAYAV